MDTAWTWDLSSYCAKYSFLTEPKGLTMREVERIFQLDPEPPVLENMNDYIIEAVRSRELRWFSFFLHCYENRLNGRVRCFLLREGLDLPEVSRVAILDADKEGFLRSHRSLTQTAGRAARNVNGKVIMYADRITDSMRQTIDETNRRREKQLAYNEAHGITPKQITRSRANALLDIEKQSSQENSSKPKEPRAYTETEAQLHAAADPVVQYMSKGQLQKSIEQTRKLMQEAAKKLDFIEAAQYRDELLKLEELLKEKS